MYSSLGSLRGLCALLDSNLEFFILVKMAALRGDLSNWLIHTKELRTIVHPKKLVVKFMVRRWDRGRKTNHGVDSSVKGLSLSNAFGVFVREGSELRKLLLRGRGELLSRNAHMLTKQAFSHLLGYIRTPHSRIHFRVIAVETQMDHVGRARRQEFIVNY